ncbi:MAG: hypothetical protein ABFD08_17655 [Syntrophomonas sp.]
MFNYQNLNDYEFELLCKDILEVELHTNLRTYSKGRDGGIDISCFLFRGTVIQVKHYINSSYASLLSSLKNELTKVKILKPRKYYVCTSIRLSPPQITEIFNIFKEFMVSTQNIYDGVRIDDILKKHVDIIYKHYKLWLTSTNVLELVNNKDIFIDTEELMFGIKEEICLFVKTKAYEDAIKILKKENLIIILGDPGVGKTTISKMLLLYYSKKGYCVRYASDNSIKDIKKALSLDLSKKEIILMDDFLGQHYVNLKEDQPNEIKTLMAYILRNKNKKLILNSRITILNEALRRSFKLNNFIIDHKIRKYQINLNEMSVVEKALILYNHIYFNSLQIEYFNQIKMENRYIKIIDHKNYNPRIVEYVTKKRNYKNCDPNRYYNYILDNLNNPKDVWDDEFNNRVSNFDRIFMHTLYSLTDTFVGEVILKECFNWRIKGEPNYDSTQDIYAECLKRLTESMIRMVEDKKEKKIGVINPSINDYILFTLSNNENEVDHILDYSIYIEQLDRMREINEEKVDKLILKKLNDNHFLSMKTINKTTEFYYLLFILKNKFRSTMIKDNLIDIISNSKTYSDNPRNNTSPLLCQLFSDDDIFKFYELNKLIFEFNKMKTIFNELVFEDISIFLSIYRRYFKSKEDNEWIDSLKTTIEECIIDNINEEVEAQIKDNLQEIVDNTLIGYDRYTDYLDDIVKESLANEIEILLEEKKKELDNELFLVSELVISSDYVINVIDYLSPIEAHFRYEPDDDDRDYRFGYSSYEEVHKIFNREYF